MATIPEITDRLEAATEKAENASQIIYDVANGDATTEVPTASGPTPTLKKWFQDLGSSVEPMLAGIPARLDKAILKYADYAAASSAASSLPDNQAVISPDLSGVLTAWETLSGNLVEVGKIEIDVTQFGARTTNTSAQNLAAFLNAEYVAGTDPIYVPSGVWKLTTPYDLGLKARYYGPGVLQFDIAEHKRRGGSSGSVSTPENYTLMYLYDSESDVRVLFDGVAQAITWVNYMTVQAPGSLQTVQVNIQVDGGRLPLGEAPASLLAGNSFGFGGGQVDPVAPPDAGWFGTDNTSYGTRSQMSTRRGVNNSSFGSRSLQLVRDGANNSGFGFNALYRLVDASDNTAIGSIAGEWLISGDGNTLLGAAAGGHLTNGNGNTNVGYFAGHDNMTGLENTNVGYRAGAHTGTSVTSEPGYINSVSIGAYAGAFSVGSFNSYTGYRAGCGPNNGSTGAYNVANGYFAARNITTAQYLVALGAGAAANITTGNNVVAIGGEAAENIAGGQDIVAAGFRALETGTANRTVALGTYALQSGAKTAMDGSTATGFQAGQMATANWLALYGYRSGKALTTGDNNCAFGPDSLLNATTGRLNLALGAGSLNLKIDGTPFNLTGCTGVGQATRASGDNQVQLGASGTTTYAYGAVQDRSDARDKTADRDTILGLDFINALRPVDFKWDMRDDYFEKVSRTVEREIAEESWIDTGLVDSSGASIQRLEIMTSTVEEVVDEYVPIPKDGSKARSRYHHGLLAQEVRDVMERLGVDFGGFQDHSINGGCDVLSIGYTELIAPLIKAVQELSDRVKELESR